MIFGPQIGDKVCRAGSKHQFLNVLRYQKWGQKAQVQVLVCAWWKFSFTRRIETGGIIFNVGTIKHIGIFHLATAAWATRLAKHLPPSFSSKCLEENQLNLNRSTGNFLIVLRVCLPKFRVLDATGFMWYRQQQKAKKRRVLSHWRLEFCDALANVAGHLRYFSRCAHSTPLHKNPIGPCSCAESLAKQASTALKCDAEPWQNL